LNEKGKKDTPDECSEKSKRTRQIRIKVGPSPPEVGGPEQKPGVGLIKKEF